MPHLKFYFYDYLKPMKNYIVIEGSHKNPNDISTIIKDQKKSTVLSQKKRLTILLNH